MGSITVITSIHPSICNLKLGSTSNSWSVLGEPVFLGDKQPLSSSPTSCHSPPSVSRLRDEKELDYCPAVSTWGFHTTSPCADIGPQHSVDTCQARTFMDLLHHLYRHMKVLIVKSVLNLLALSASTCVKGHS